MAAPALWLKHRKIARAIAREYRLSGADHSDVEQEALIALWEACRYHDPAKGSFPAFARLVIHRRLRDRMKVVNRHYHPPALSDDVVDGREPFEILWERKEIARIRRGAQLLTPLERRALADTLNGIKQDKEADNAVYRARRKLRAAA